jgi:hypothetical protein
MVGENKNGQSLLIQGHRTNAYNDGCNKYNN